MKPLDEGVIVYCPYCIEPYHRHCWRKAGYGCKKYKCKGSTLLRWAKIEFVLSKFIGAQNKLSHKCSNESCRNYLVETSPFYRYCTQCGKELHSPRVEEGIFAYDYFEFIARHITILLSALLLLIFSAVLYTPIASSFNQAELPQDPITEISASTQEPIRDTPSSKSTPNSVSTPTIVLSATPVPTANALETRRAVELTRTAMPESSATVEGFDINTFNARNTRQASETKQAATEQAIKVEETPTHILPTQTNVEATCSVATGPRWGPTLWNQYKDRLSCPLSQEIRTGGAFQIYQRGITIWRQDADRIYILYSNGTYASYSDDSPAGYSVSNMVKGGFGYLWQNNSTVREGLGEPVTAEANATNFAAQDFASGTILYFLENEAFNYVLFADNHRWTSTQD